MSEWKKVKIGDVAKFQNGYAFKSGDFLQAGKFRVIKIKELKENKIKFFQDSAFVDLEELSLRKYMVRQNAVLFALTGDPVSKPNPNSWVGRVAMLKSDESCYINQRVCKSIFTNKIDPYFFYYNFLLFENYFSLASKALGSANQANISTKIIEEESINLPPLEEQKAIADVLSCLDDKIELNNKINKNLEEQAQALFKRWFVDFEFPNEDSNPYKSSGGEMVDSELGKIPKDWDVKSLDEIADFINGYSYKGSDLTDSKYAMVTIKNFDRTGGFKIEGYKEVIIKNTKPQHSINIFDILVAHTDITQNADIIGNAEQVPSFGKYEGLIFSMDLVKVVIKENKLSSFLFALLKYGNFKQHALGYVSGTTVLHLSKKALPEYKFAYSNEENLLIYFNALIQNISKLKCNIINENQKLADLRDYLLPKLMSGEIRVKL